MSIYLVALNDPAEDAWIQVRESWPERHYILTDRLAFIAPEDTLLTETVGEMVGMNEERKLSGFVVEITYEAINGWNRPGLWEWMRKYQ